MLKILILLFLSGNLYAKPISCKTHPGYCQIVQNNKYLSKDYAMRLSNLVHKLTEKYKIDKNIYLAILMQESSYNLNSKNCSKKGFNSYGEIDRTCYDFGLGQISFANILARNLDEKRLTTDLEYSLTASIEILAEMKRTFKKEKYWWARYNAYQNGPKSRKARKRYVKKVSKYFYKSINYELDSSCD